MQQFIGGTWSLNNYWAYKHFPVTTELQTVRTQFDSGLENLDNRHVKWSKIMKRRIFNLCEWEFAWMSLIEPLNFRESEMLMWMVQCIALGTRELLSSCFRLISFVERNSFLDFSLLANFKHGSSKLEFSRSNNAARDFRLESFKPNIWYKAGVSRWIESAELCQTWTSNGMSKVKFGFQTLENSKNNRFKLCKDECFNSWSFLLVDVLIQGMLLGKSIGNCQKKYDNDQPKLR